MNDDKTETLERETPAQEVRGEENAELNLEIKVLRTKIRTSIRGGTCGMRGSGPNTDL